MKRKIIAIVTSLSILFSFVVPSSAINIDDGTCTLLYTQTQIYDGQLYVFELYSDGTSLVYVDGEKDTCYLQLEADGAATATVTKDDQTEDYVLDIDNLYPENVEFDIYSASESNIALQSADDPDLEPIVHIDSLEQLESIVTGRNQGRAAIAITVTVLSLLLLVYVAVILPSASRFKLYPIKWTHKEKRIPSSGHVERQCVPRKWTHQQIGNP